MTNSKFTPGPWEIEKRGKYHEVKIYTGKIGLPNETGYCVFTPTPYYDTVQQEANARLIAAAPTMASRIQGAIDCLSQHKVFPADIEQAKRLLADALNTAGIDILPLDRGATPNATSKAA